MGLGGSAQCASMQVHLGLAFDKHLIRIPLEILTVQEPFSQQATFQFTVESCEHQAFIEFSTSRRLYW